MKCSLPSAGMNPAPALCQHRQTHPSALTPSTLSCCALIRKKGIALQPAPKPGLSLLFYFVKEDETQRKGKLRFYAIPFKIFIRLGRARKESVPPGVMYFAVSSLVNWGPEVQAGNKVDWCFSNYKGIRGKVH